MLKCSLLDKLFIWTHQEYLKLMTINQKLIIC